MSSPTFAVLAMAFAFPTKILMFFCDIKVPKTFLWSKGFVPLTTSLHVGNLPFPTTNLARWRAACFCLGKPVPSICFLELTLPYTKTFCLFPVPVPVFAMVFFKAFFFGFHMFFFVGALFIASAVIVGVASSPLGLRGEPRTQDQRPTPAKHSRSLKRIEPPHSKP